MNFRVDDPLVVPFTKESPFLIPFMKTFAMMRRVGVLSDIYKNYQSHEVKQCSSGLVNKSNIIQHNFFHDNLIPKTFLGSL